MDSTSPQTFPLRYEPTFEIPGEHEAKTRDELEKTLLGISETTFKDSGHANRSVHAKSHGLLRGELRVLEGLPAALAQGIFARPGGWPVVLRLSTTPGDMLDDSVSTPRGIALKVVGVEGERLAGSEDAVTQDFVMVNGPVFGSAGPEGLVGPLKLLAPTTDKAPNVKKAISAVLRGTERLLEAVGGGSGTIMSLGGHPETNLLGDTYYTQVPILYGPYMAKLSLAPVSPELTALTGAALDVNGKPNGLRDAVVAFFSSTSAEWELRVQLCTDLRTMPIEDASVRWPEDASPFIAVARIVALPQPAWNATLSAFVDDGMSFNPWHGIAAHRPLGSVMRVRKMVYEMSAGFRFEKNGRSIEEPKTLHDMP
jgi:hypothetical protein